MNTIKIIAKFVHALITDKEILQKTNVPPDKFFSENYKYLLCIYTELNLKVGDVAAFYHGIFEIKAEHDTNCLWCCPNFSSSKIFQIIGLRLSKNFPSLTSTQKEAAMKYLLLNGITDNMLLVDQTNES